MTEEARAFVLSEWFPWVFGGVAIALTFYLIVGIITTNRWIARRIGDLFARRRRRAK